MQPSAHWKTIGQLIRPDAWRYGALALVLGCASALPLAGPLVVRHVIDAAAAGTTSSSVARWGFVYLVLAMVAQAATVFVAFLATVLAWRTANDLRLRLTRHVLGLDQEFQRSHPPGELIHRVDGDVTSVSDLLGRVSVAIGGAAILTGGMVIVVAVIDWRLGIAMAIYAGLGIYVLVGQRDRALDEATDESAIKARLYGEIEEQLTASLDLRSNGAGQYGLQRLVKVCSDALPIVIGREVGFVRAYARTMAVIASGMVLSLVFGAYLTAKGTISVGTAFLLFQFTTMLRRPLELAIDELPMVHKASGAAVRVSELLAMRPTITYTGAASPAPGPLAVEFSDVSFDYGEEPVLEQISVHFPAGESTGIVGRTGSGKTTLSRLVLRLVEASNGCVSLGGIPIGDLAESELRHRVALVPQEVQLLSGTVRDNVTLYDTTVDDRDVLEALAEVGLDRLVEAGLDSPVGSGGDGLSAGEAQLLALARVWLRKPDVVVLDEATARVDPGTEQVLQHAIGRLLEGRTSLVIAHRLSTLRHVDNVLVLEQGRVAEFGKRADLEADSSGRYAKLISLALAENPA